MQVLEFIVGLLSCGDQSCSHVETAVHFRPCLKEAGIEGSDSSGAVSRADGIDKSGKKDILNRDKMMKHECRPAEFKIVESDKLCSIY